MAKGSRRRINWDAIYVPLPPLLAKVLLEGQDPNLFHLCAFSSTLHSAGIQGVSVQGHGAGEGRIPSCPHLSWGLNLNLFFHY